MTPFEAVVAADLIRQGYKVLSSGWPDLCAAREENGKTVLRFIEVKSANDNLRASQKRMHDILRAAGIEVELVRESTVQPMTWAEPNPSRPFQPHRGGRPDDKFQASLRFIETALHTDGPVLIKTLIRNAYEQENLHRSTLYHAAKVLRVDTNKTRQGLTWSLPRIFDIVSDAQDQEKVMGLK